MEQSWAKPGVRQHILALTMLCCSALISTEAPARTDAAGGAGIAALQTPAVVEPVAVSPPSQPTRVTISGRLLGLERVSEVSDPEPDFDASYWVEMRWADPRLVFAGQQSRHYLEEDALAELARIWNPAIVIDHENGSRESRAASLMIAPDGTVTYEEKFKTRIAAEYNLRAFPFDVQHFTLAVTPDWGEGDAVFEPAPAAPASRRPDRPSEWRLMPASTRIESRVDANGSSRSTFVYDVPAHRNGAFYLIKLILPLIVIVILSWSNFWITGRGEGRIRLTFVCLLAVIAYETVLSRFLPRLTVLTVLDWIILLALISLGASVVENAWVHQLLLKNSQAKADRIDWWARRLIPGTVTLGIVVSAAVGFL